MKVSQKARRLAKNIRRKKNLASRRYNSTLRFVHQCLARRRLFLAVPLVVGLQCVIVVFSDNTQLLS